MITTTVEDEELQQARGSILMLAISDLHDATCQVLTLTLIYKQIYSHIISPYDRCSCCDATDRPR